MNFQLRRKANTIYILFYRNSNRLLLSTQLKIENTKWDEKRKKIKLNTATDYLLQEKITQKIDKISRLILDNPNASNSKIKDLFKSNKVAAVSFWQVYEDFLIYIKNTGTPIRHTRYKDIKEKLKLINPHLDFEAVNLKLYDSILEWYFSKNYSVNYIGRQIRYIKSFLHWAAARGYIDEYSFRGFKSISQETEVYYLTETELLQLATAPMPTTRKDMVRDLFVFMCYTGLRHSDAVALLPANFSNKMLTKSIIKTNEPALKIPLMGLAWDIAVKYNFNLPKISSQKMNVALRKIGEIAEIKTPTIVVKYNANGRVETVVEKFELITSKMARKTFVTLSLQKGIPAEVIMSITGHKDHKVMRKYLKIDATLKIEQMNKWA